MHFSKHDKAVQPHTGTIHSDRFQPFTSRQGIDDVMRLRFEYQPALVARLKALLSVYGHGHQYRTVGGWLAEHRCWFCEIDVWDTVKLELLYLGYEIVEAQR